jgi:hypothetical protein
MRRHNKKWGVNEVLALQREYELLELSVKEIAIKHERSNKSILFKLTQEGFIDNWESARGFDECNLSADYFSGINDNVTSSLQSQSNMENQLSEENSYMIERVETLEKNMFEFRSILTKLLNEMSHLKTQFNSSHLNL